MTVQPNRNQIRYTSAAVESNYTFEKLKKFFSLRRDDSSPFSPEEILEAYQICVSGRTFVSRPGDMIVLLSDTPKGKRVSDRLRVRKAAGLYGLACKTDGFALQTDGLNDNFDRDYYIIGRPRDEKILDLLARECISVRVVGQVTRKGYYLCRENEVYDEIALPEQEERCAKIPNDFSYKAGCLQGFYHVFTNSEITVNGNVGMALGVFSAFCDSRYDRALQYNGVKKGDGLFLYPVSHYVDTIPDYRTKKVYKILKKKCKDKKIGGCVLFNDGNLASALEKLTGAPAEGELKELRQGVWYVLVASHTPLRNGIYLGKI